MYWAAYRKAMAEPEKDAQKLRATQLRNLASGANSSKDSLTTGLNKIAIELERLPPPASHATVGIWPIGQ
jgi:hypothetical protein